MKKVYIREEYCAGCGLCEVYCATVHSAYPHDVLKAFTLLSDKPKPRLLVERKGSISFAWACRHCDDAPCVSACITGALTRKAPQGVVLLDKDRCISCFTCVVACPFGAVYTAGSSQSSVLKCDLCSGILDIPACVEKCPNEALRFMEGVEK